jgi:fructose 1,6-bisphosphate aldolase/phosphatase
MNFPATGEILAPLAVGHFVAGCMRGSHQMPLMPVRLGSGISYFDGPPVIFCATFVQRDGRLTEPLDAFTPPFGTKYAHGSPPRRPTCGGRASSAPRCCL